ncbi:MAG: deoxyribonuclease IV [Nitrospinota bacterium]|nr:deoxyribonuclease IV [Nitrospinota bacterium]
MNKKVPAESAPRPWGAHISIAGGVEKSPARGEAIGAAAIQIFTKNNTRWAGPPILPAQAAQFQEQSRLCGVQAVASHVCYLVNLASAEPEISKKSREAFLDEMDRADLLGIPYLVFHPGAHMGAGEEDGMKRVADCLGWAMDQRPKSRTLLTLETTAGQGTGLGHRFSQLARIIELTGNEGRLGVCVDTCHIFAAGYGLASRKEYQATFAEFQAELGLERIKLFHINDSKKPQGARVDRHEHIGKGAIGAEGFRLLVNDTRFAKAPMILETPKGPDGAEDIENLKFLKGLIGK